MDMNISRLPLHMIELLELYAEEHEPVNDEFLEALLCNNLRGACQEADDQNIELIPVYVAYLHNNVPSVCWGSVDRYRAWLEEV